MRCHRVGKRYVILRSQGSPPGLWKLGSLGMGDMGRYAAMGSVLRDSFLADRRLHSTDSKASAGSPSWKTNNRSDLVVILYSCTYAIYARA